MAQTYKRIPRSCAQADAVITNSQATDTVFMAVQRSHLLASKRVPNLKHNQLLFPMIAISTGALNIPCIQNRRIQQTVIVQTQRMLQM